MKQPSSCVRIRLVSAPALALLLALLPCGAQTLDGHTVGQGGNDRAKVTPAQVLAEIERMAASKEESVWTLDGSAVDGIEKGPADVSKGLLLKLKDKKLKDKQLAVYIWALGLTRDEASVSAIREVYQQSKSELVRINCLRALATIGGKQAEEFILSTLADTTDKKARFDILSLLGQMQCESALPKSEEILKQDKEMYWQSVFVFGKMGDKAVPFLLGKIDDQDVNVRGNALNVIGQWLIPLEASKPLQDQFWKERDAGLRYVILCSLERIIPDLTQMQAFFEKVAIREKDGALGDFASETLDNMDKMKAAVVTYAGKKKPSGLSFQSDT